jgi:hypothetical protein
VSGSIIPFKTIKECSVILNNNMTFKEYLKTPAAKKQIKKLSKNRTALPQCKASRHTDSSTMFKTNTLPAATPEQPSLS